MKIYLWFWLATITLIVTGMIVDRVTESGPHGHFRRQIGQMLSAYGRAAVEISEEGAGSPLQIYLNALEEATHTKYFIFDHAGHEINGKKPPDEVGKLLARTERGDPNQFPVFEGKGVGAQRIVSRSGQIYIIIEKKERPFLPLPPPFPENLSSLLLKVVAALVVSGIVCYILTRYLFSPLVELSRAARQMAGGNLSVRVRSVLGKRKDEIGQLAKDFDMMAERVESLMVSQRSLLRDVSHELRSPLTRLYVAVELCQQRLNPEAMKSLERITREADKLSELIGQILNLNRIESGISGLDKKREDLRVLVQEIVDDANFEAKGMNRAVKILPGEACAVMCNRVLLQSAIENVVRNSIRYTANNSEVEIAIRPVRNIQESLVSVSVSDRGPGVPESELVHLFKPFYRFDNGHGDTACGTGLGLTIAEAAVRLHGGTIRAANIPGGGLLIEMLLPVY